jgi:hypothetical protein
MVLRIENKGSSIVRRYISLSIVLVKDYMCNIKPLDKVLTLSILLFLIHALERVSK